MSQPANDDFSQHLSDGEESNHEDASDTEILAVRKRKAGLRIYLPMAIPKEICMRRFHGMDDAKEIWEAIRTSNDAYSNEKFDKKTRKREFAWMEKTCWLETIKKLMLQLSQHGHFARVMYTRGYIDERRREILLSTSRSWEAREESMVYEEEMNFFLFLNVSKEDSIGKPSYNRFTKTNDFKGVPHPLSGDYTPKPQEEIDDSLYVYVKDLVETTSEHSLRLISESLSENQRRMSSQGWKSVQLNAGRPNSSTTLLLFWALILILVRTNSILVQAYLLIAVSLKLMLTILLKNMVVRGIFDCDAPRAHDRYKESTVRILKNSMWVLLPLEHKVLFTETECLVVSSDFKMPDENQILLKILLAYSSLSSRTILGIHKLLEEKLEKIALMAFQGQSLEKQHYSTPSVNTGNSKDFSSQCCQENLQVSQGQTKLGIIGYPRWLSISWTRLSHGNVRKSDNVATSTTEAEYVVLKLLCGSSIADVQMKAGMPYILIPTIYVPCDELFEGMGQNRWSHFFCPPTLLNTTRIGPKEKAMDELSSSSFYIDFKNCQALERISNNHADNGVGYCEVSQESEASWTGFGKRECGFGQESEKKERQDDPLDSSVQGLVTPSSTKVNASGEEKEKDISPNTLKAAKTLSKVASLKPRSIDKGMRYKRRKEAKGKKVVSSLDFQEEADAGAEQVNTVSAERVNTAKGVNTGSIKLSTVSEQFSTGNEQVNTVGAKKSTSSQDKGQREGKAPMISEETPKKSKEQVLQEEASLAEAIRLDTLQKEKVAKQVHLDSLLAQRIAEEEELNEQQKKRKAQVQFEAQHYTNEDWDLIRAKIEANAELSKSMLGSELQGEDFAKKMVDLVNQRKKYFAEERAKAKRNKPMTQSQLKTYMMNYLKNQGTWKLSQLKNLSFEEVKEEFDKLVKQVESFAPINFEATKASLKRFGEELQTKTPKRMKDDEAKDDEPTKKSGKRRKQMARKGLHTSIDKDDSEGSDEDSEQDDSVTGTKTPINPVPVAMKTPSIATYKIIKQGEKGAYQIVREDGTDVVYINFGAMLKSISRDDLTELYRIVMNRYGMDGPEDKLEKIFWKYLKDMFEEPLSTDPVWSVLSQKRIISWRYYDTCRVHCLNLESMDIYMLSERKYPLSAEVCQTMLKMKLLDGKMNEDCYKMLKMMEKQAGIRK
ncbi:hypothetical protein Tco_0533084 [Tanacetum coccineum]